MDYLIAKPKKILPFHINPLFLQKQKTRNYDTKTITSPFGLHIITRFDGKRVTMAGGQDYGTLYSNSSLDASILTKINSSTVNDHSELPP